MECAEASEFISGPSSLSSDQPSLCVIPEPYDSSEEDDFIHLDKTSLPTSLTSSDNDRTVIVFHSVEEEYAVTNDILCRYIRPKGWIEAQQDYIGLFKVGWVTVGECVMMVPVPMIECHNNSIGCVIFPAQSLPMDNTNFYQFCYLRDSVLSGASTPFQFKLAGDHNCSLGPDGSKENFVNHHVEEKLTLQLRSRELDLSRLQEKFTKLACSKDEQDKVYYSTVEGLEKQLAVQSACIKKLADEKAGLETEKSYLTQEIHKLSSQVEDLKTRPSPVDDTMKSQYNILSGSSTPASSFWSGLIFEDIAPPVSSVDLISNTKQGAMRTADNQHEESAFLKLTCEAELMQLRQRLSEVIEEKQLFQEQYNMASLALKKCTDELTALNVHVSELHMNHGVLVEKLESELQATKDKLQEFKNASLPVSDKDNSSVSSCVNHQVHEAISENVYLREELEYLRNILKKFEENAPKTGCKCEDLKNRLEELEVHLSASDLVKATLQAELDEELKLGEDRDRRLAQVEQTMLCTLRSESEQAASAFEAVHGTSISEMEQNVQSALEALECALKEIETLRSRKAALSRVNRSLRDGFTSEKVKWEKKIQDLREGHASILQKFSKRLESESSNRLSLQKEMEEKQNQNDLNLQRLSELEGTDLNMQNKEMEANTRCVLEALEDAQKEIESLREERCSLLEQCTLLRQQLEEKEKRGGACHLSEEVQDHSCGLAGKLQEACDEYRKLYVEKKRIQEKLDRLQQKIKTKVNARGPLVSSTSEPSTSQTFLSTSSPNFDSSDCVSYNSAAWREMVEGLM